MQYVKKPIPIQAQQIVLGGSAEPWLYPFLGIKLQPDGTGGFWVETNHGRVYAKPGDWILQAVDGEIYPCSDEVFRATYDVAPRGPTIAFVVDSEVTAKRLERDMPAIPGMKFYPVGAHLAGFAFEKIIFRLNERTQVSYRLEIQRWRMRLLPEGSIVWI